MPDPIVCQFHDLSHDGMGVGKVNECIVFADGVLPQETALIQITSKKKNFMLAQVQQLMTVSKDRVDPVCPLFHHCGGCQIMHLRDEAQLQFKKKKVSNQIKKTLGLTFDFPIVPSLPTLNYRNKIVLHSDGKILGFHRKHSHTLVDIPHCYIAQPVINRLIEMMRKEQALISSLSSVTLRTNLREDQVTLLCDVKDFQPAQAFAKKIGDDLAVKGVVAKKGSQVRVLHGSREIEETYLQHTFTVDCEAFLQINTAQAEKLYRYILQLIQPQKGSVILDGFCGIGILAQLLALQGAFVIGIDIVPEAIASAKRNQKKFPETSCEFHCQAFEHFLIPTNPIDWLVLNPPRGGLDPKAFKTIERLQAHAVIYVSCDPATLCRDLTRLVKMGYQIQTGQLFDLFPQTAHVETVVHLNKA